MVKIVIIPNVFIVHHSGTVRLLSDGYDFTILFYFYEKKRAKNPTRYKGQQSI